MVIPETELTAERLAETVSRLMADRARLATMGAAARRLAHPDAARTIAEMAARLAGETD